MSYSITPSEQARLDFNKVSAALYQYADYLMGMETANGDERISYPDWIGKRPATYNIVPTIPTIKFLNEQFENN